MFLEFALSQLAPTRAPPPSKARAATPTFLYALVASLIAVALVPFALVAYQTWIASESLIDQAQRTQLLLAKASADRIASGNDSLQEALTALAHNPQLLEDPNSTAAQEAITGALIANADVLAIATFYDDGHSDLLVKLARQKQADDIVEQVLRGATETPSLLPLKHARNAILLSHATSRPGLRVVGALRANAITQALNPVELGDASDLTLLTGTQPNDAMLGAPLVESLANFARTPLSSGASRFNVANRLLIGAFAQVPHSSWRLVAVQPAAQAQHTKQAMIRGALWALALVAILVAALAALAWKIILAPVRKLLRLQRRVLGNTTDGGSDDIAQLRDSFRHLEAFEQNRETLGRVFLDRYKIVSALGQGAMGSVFRAWDPRLCRDVAIKTVRLNDQDESQRMIMRVNLENEAIAVAALQHPNVVAAYDFLIRDEFAFVVMEFIEGENLRALIKRQPLNEAECRAVAFAILRALDAAHTAGFLHRDIKPANVLLSHTGAIKLGDFGVASRRLDTRRGEDNAAIGTAGYIAPECLAGDAASERSDLFALGMLLVECITGQSPYLQRDAVHSAQQNLQAATHIGEDFRAFLSGLIAANPDQRFANAKLALVKLTTRETVAGFNALAARTQKQIAPAKELDGQTKLRGTDA
jgi:tRNA A-37 threonylcarbamoyl transferase component Bud32